MAEVDLTALKSTWNPDAATDRIDYLFHQSHHFRAVDSGDRIIVVGRKGAGKTAIARKIQEKSPTEAIVINLTLSDFDPLFNLQPTNDALRDFNIAKMNWQFVILRGICQQLLDSTQLDRGARNTLSEIFPGKIDEAITGSKVKLGRFELGLGLPGAQITIGGAKSTQNTHLSPSQRVNLLFDFVSTYSPESVKTYALFDDLDVGYLQACQSGQQVAYLATLAALVHAAREIWSKFKAQGKSVIPVVFMRSDVYDLIQDSDKTKWDRANTIRLDWTAADLREMIIYRLSRTPFKANSAESPADVVRRFFRASTYTTEGRKRRDYIDLIIDYTFLRPRDAVNMMHLCAAGVGRGQHISRQIVQSAATEQAEHLISEARDELSGEIRAFDQILEILASLPLQFDFSKIVDSCNEIGIPSPDARNYCQRLFSAGLIGYRMQTGDEVFVYNKRGRLNENLPLLSNPAIRPYLGLSSGDD